MLLTMTDKALQHSKEIWKRIAPTLLKRYKRDHTFLDYHTPWELTVAVILSAQTTDNRVNKATPALFKAFPTPKKLAQANITDIEAKIKTLGFYRAKARHIQNAAKVLLKEFGGVVPDDEKAIQKLPGVGRKSAVAIISNAYNKNIGIPVDTHVIRFVKRFGLTNAIDPSKIEQDLLQIIPKKDWKRAGYAIKEYGRKEGRARGYKPEEDPVMRAVKK
ncbi:MAG TPA: endonuclease III [Candidatus Paceibacterota bacterium]|nr:endonuclease III [Candidatus Paceibacterota bacterium]